MTKLDAIDRRILRARRRDGQIQNVELAEEVSLSAPPCLRRVKPLGDAGAIERHVALLDPAKIGVGLTLFARARLIGQDVEMTEHFTEEVRPLPQIVECLLTAGYRDFLLRIVAPSLARYCHFQIDHLCRIKSMQSVKTEIVMQKIRLTSGLSL